MMKRSGAPRVRDFMTPVPISVQPGCSTREARALMHEKEIRHLLVKRGSRLLGLVSERNLEALTGALLDQLTVADVMTPRPYAVSPAARLADVASVMAKAKYGSAVVRRRDGRVVGIFTTVDACRALAELIRRWCPE